MITAASYSYIRYINRDRLRRAYKTCLRGKAVHRGNWGNINQERREEDMLVTRSTREPVHHLIVPVVVYLLLDRWAVTSCLVWCYPMSAASCVAIVPLIFLMALISLLYESVSLRVEQRSRVSCLISISALWTTPWESESSVRSPRIVVSRSRLRLSLKAWSGVANILEVLKRHFPFYGAHTFKCRVETLNFGGTPLYPGLRFEKLRSQVTKS